QHTFQKVADDVVGSFVSDPDGTIWITSVTHLLKQLVPSNPKMAIAPPNAVEGVTLLRDRRGTFWIGTRGRGLIHAIAPGFEGSATQVKLIRDSHHPDGSVTVLFEDRDGAIWTASETGGLVRFSVPQIEIIGHEEGLTSMYVRAMESSNDT